MSHTTMSFQMNQMATSPAETCGSTLADLYACLARVNKQLAGLPKAVPLTTSKFENAWVSRDRSAKARQEAASRKRGLLAEQGSLRAAIGSKSKRGVRELHVFDLPEEIICQIFEHLRGSPYVEEASGLACLRHASKDIRNVRLTCRRFYGASSHLLLSLITLDLSAASASRIRDISQQPLIRRGVRGVKVQMQFYDEGLAHSLRDFAIYNIVKLRQEIRRLEGLSEWNNNEKDIKKANLIVNSWLALVENPLQPAHAMDERHLRYQNLLLDAHEEYKLLRKKQCNTLEDGSFIKAVGQALSRMPQVKGLQLCGGNWFDNVRIRFGVLKSDHILRQALLLPMTCHEMDFQPIQTLNAWGQLFHDQSNAQTISNSISRRVVGKSRRHVQKVMLSDFVISTSLLENFLNCLGGSPLKVTLKNVGLKTGTWEGILDLLRQHDYCVWRIDEPVGAELNLMAVAEKRRIFGSSRSKSSEGLSLAESYIAGVPGFTNPFTVDTASDEE
ncbi:hypothetical protein PFICI_05591 [Pestalotiopsis fici W106-1]|uniref:Uncharacterized protein n=1 Tax=Pestalotiopsis fici (strain W106-1 / CGMCC3.15140) TaxID=1229662 RepID=W3XCD9_PESFW|nr:uncharacterized protein PFICI_05591 [Pestalotiopsis fici W106-1]ETS83715.1 hypothetical protein PFICI_05591 [Pestalotiopsis fici W106-1]